MRNSLFFGSLALAAIVWTGASAQQEMLPRPGPGSGVTKVVGTVSIDTLPDVNAKQLGDWRVAITDLPDVSVSAPAFLRRGVRYRVTWPNGDVDTFTVAAVGRAGWIQVEQGRWLNLGNARSVDPLP